MTIKRRLAHLEGAFSAELTEGISEVSPEWREVVAQFPELREAALALADRQKLLWPTQEPPIEELLDDDECRTHWLRLGSAAHGGLANLLALGFD